MMTERLSDDMHFLVINSASQLYTFLSMSQYYKTYEQYILYVLSVLFEMDQK